MTEGKNIKRKKHTGWWLLLAAALVVGGFIGWRVLTNRRAARETLANIETEPYQRMSLDANIFGTGTVEPAQTVVLSWSASGKVGEVLVKIGQEVEEGQHLMSLDPESVSMDIKQAEIDLINAQNNLDALYDNWESQLTQTKLDLLKAEENLEDLETKRERMNYQRCSDERIEELEDALENAEKLYGLRQTAQNLIAVNTAQANLDFCRSEYSDREISEADLEIQLAETRVSDLHAEIDLLADGPDPDQVVIFETQLAIAQSRLDSPLIEAPFKGVVTVLSSQEGDLVQPGMQALQIDDLSELHLDVQISEIDIPFVQAGQPAQLVFDAFFETTFTGEVIQIAPVGQNIQGVVEYAVRINLLDGDERIKPGMTAAVNIIVDRKEDVFVVPNDAIVSIDGQEKVFVRRGGNYEAVEVELGSYSDFYSEVIEADIKLGEPIVLNPPEEITGEMPFSGPPRGGFGNFGD